jgi:NADPH-dependent glutamate synthase beta subunit-like oxidoreductase
MEFLTSRWKKATSISAWPKCKPREPRFRAGVTIGVDITWDELTERYDAVVVATGAQCPRETLAIPGRELLGIYPAMEYLTPANRVQAGRHRCKPDCCRG